MKKIIFAVGAMLAMSFACFLLFILLQGRTKHRQYAALRRIIIILDEMLAYTLTYPMYRKVTFYTTADGKCPVVEFIDSQTPKVAQKITWVLKAVQEIEKVPN